MPNRLLRSLGLLAFAVASSSASATARAQMEAFFGEVRVLSAEFEQTVSASDGELVEESSGSLALSAPRQFRFEYIEPYPQLLLADGEQFWVFDPELDQASVRAQSIEEANSPLTLILEPKSLDQSFIVTEGGEESGLDWLLLSPKEERNDFDRLDLGFDASGLALMRYRDPSGQQTELRFRQWRRDPDLPADYFQFVPPPGVDVIGMQDLGGAEVKPLDD